MREAAGVAVLALTGACTSPPKLKPLPVACVETIPAGARVVTSEGEILPTPVLLPCPRGEAQRIELWLEGHAPRRVAIVPSAEPTRLAAFGACALLPLFSDESEWERVESVEGRVILTLEPLATEPSVPSAR